MRGHLYCSERCARDAGRHAVWRAVRGALATPVPARLAVAAVALAAAAPGRPGPADGPGARRPERARRAGAAPPRGSHGPPGDHRGRRIRVSPRRGGLRRNGRLSVRGLAAARLGAGRERAIPVRRRSGEGAVSSGRDAAVLAARLRASPSARAGRRGPRRRPDEARGRRGGGSARTRRARGRALPRAGTAARPRRGARAGPRSRSARPVAPGPDPRPRRPPRHPGLVRRGLVGPGRHADPRRPVRPRDPDDDFPDRRVHPALPRHRATDRARTGTRSAITRTRTRT